MLVRILLAAALAAGLSSAAHAQTARTVSVCSGQTLRVGDSAGLSVLANGDLCISGTFDTTIRGAAVYRGGTITTGGTSQQLMAQNDARRGFTVQNQSAADLYVKVGQTATTSNFSLRIAPGVLYETPPNHVSTGVVNIIGATTGQAFYATEF